jgi:hypothetical protein
MQLKVEANKLYNSIVQDLEMSLKKVWKLRASWISSSNGGWSFGKLDSSKNLNKRGESRERTHGNCNVGLRKL